MALSPAEIKKWAQALNTARLEARERDRITSEVKELLLEDAYKIHDEFAHLRIQAGAKRIGYKMGLTSEAKRQQMGLHSPIYGTLLDEMQVQGDVFRLKGTIHPKAEPEIGFLTRSELKGRVTKAQAMEATEAICGALEILDSRYVGFKYFSLPDVVADNSSASHFVFGPWLKDFRSLDLREVELRFSVDGKVVETAPGSAISGDPWNSLTQLSELLDSRGLALPAGSLVLAGAATQAVALAPGNEVRLDTGVLPVVAFRVES